MARVSIIHFGKSKVDVNNSKYATKIASGLQKILDTISNPSTEFVSPGEFTSGEPDNTWLHISLVTEGTTIIREPEDLREPVVDVVPQSQFNVHIMVKSVVDEDDFGKGFEDLTAGNSKLR